jgi:Holliday junction DNA helicase RuvA
MIGHLSGTLVEKQPPDIVVEVHGVGYELQAPMSTFYGLPATGQPIRLHTHLVVREDAHLLFGFGTADERRMFRELIRISGVGPRTALSVLSGLSVSDLSLAVAEQETGRLTRVPGIGRKTAERLLLELKGRLLAPGLGATPGAAPAADAGSDILRALLALGYSDREARAATAKLAPDVGVEDGIREALKALVRAA